MSVLCPRNAIAYCVNWSLTVRNMRSIFAFCVGEYSAFTVSEVPNVRQASEKWRETYDAPRSVVIDSGKM